MFLFLLLIISSSISSSTVNHNSFELSLELMCTGGNEFQMKQKELNDYLLIV